MNDFIARVLRVAPFVFLGSVACFLCILTTLDATSTPLLFEAEARWLALAVLLLPVTTCFDLQEDSDFAAGVVASTLLGIASAAALILSQSASLSFGVVSLFFGITLMAMITWIICCIVYFAFFVLGRGLSGVHRRLWRKHRQKV